MGNERKAGKCRNHGGCGSQGATIERTPFPKFDGNHENWAELKMYLKELMEESGQSEVLEMARLTGKIPEEAKCIISARETGPWLTSDMGKKTVSALAHYFLLPKRANSVNILSIYPP